MFRTGNFIRSFLISAICMLFMLSTSIFAQMYDSSTTQSTKSGMYGDDMKNMIEKRASDLTSDLQTKVNLTDSQVSAVKSDLIDYMTKVATLQNSQRAGLKEKSPMDSSSNMSNSDNSTSQELKNADSDASLKIESLITEDQKSKWSDIKDSWWGEVKSVAYNNSMNK